MFLQVFTGRREESHGFYASSPHFVSTHLSLTQVGECGQVLVLSVTCFERSLLGEHCGTEARVIVQLVKHFVQETGILHCFKFMDQSTFSSRCNYHKSTSGNRWIEDATASDEHIAIDFLCKHSATAVTLCSTPDHHNQTNKECLKWKQSRAMISAMTNLHCKAIGMPHRHSIWGTQRNWFSV